MVSWNIIDAHVWQCLCAVVPIGQAGADCMRTLLHGKVRGPVECFRVVRSCLQTLTDAGFEEDVQAVRADIPEPKFG